MKCEGCRREVGAVYRQNAKGEKAIWRCTRCAKVQPDPETREIVSILEEAFRAPTEVK